MTRFWLILSSYSKIYQTVTLHLLHGDYGPKHILVNNDKISGILDFESIKSGDPVWDFSWWDYFGKHRPSISRLKEGYEIISQLPSNYELRVRLYRLRLGMILIYYYETEGNKSGIAIAINNLNEDLEYFKAI